MFQRCIRPTRALFWIILFLFFVVLQLLFMLSTFSHSTTQNNDTADILNVLRKKAQALEKATRQKKLEKTQTQRVYGPGEYGVGFEIKEEDLDEGELAKYREGYDEHRFNEYASDLISLHRKLPPVLQDERCKALVYPSDLPNVSVVIPFKDEAWSTLLRTVHGVLERSDPKLLKEIILVDDNSTLPHLKKRLDIYLSQLPNITMVRLNRSSGLMMARQAGIDRAQSDVIIVMDSHVEVAEGWLEPLLLPIYQDYKVLTFARMDSINKDNFKYNAGRVGGFLQVPNFDFYLNMIFSPMSKEFIAQRKNITDPVPSPTVQGWMFAMNRQFFMALGGFDPGMDAWGGEQFELSFKVWMCGGRILTPPCSIAGHVYREVKWKNIWNTFHQNNYRLASVWMDEYYDLYRERTASIADPGDVSDRKAIRDRMQCKGFDWYLNTVEKFVDMYIPRNRKAKGMIRNELLDLCIYCEFHGDREFVPSLKKCREGWGQDWDMSEKDELRHQHQCFDPKQNGTLVTRVCDHSRTKSNQKWIYTQHNTLLHNATQKCLGVPENDGSTLELVVCDTNSARQLWNWTRLI